MRTVGAMVLGFVGMPPTDGWKQQHDDSYLKNAIEKAQKQAQTKPKQ